MRYEMMRPGQIQEAVKSGLPLLMPAGVLEYHGPQNPTGVDALISQGIAHLVEKEVDCVVAPTIFYGYTGNWAAGVDKGEIHIEGDALYGFVKPVIKAFLRQGWRKIYIIIHHQGPSGVTQLSFQRAATEAIFEHGRELGGDGWFEAVDGNQGFFNRIVVVGDSVFAGAGYGGHGGKDETDAMMFLYPDTVDLKELNKADKLPRWAADAHEATREEGERIGRAIVDAWVKELKSNSYV